MILVSIISLLALFNYMKFFGHSLIGSGMVSMTYKGKILRILGKHIHVKLGDPFYVVYDSIYISRDLITNFYEENGRKRGATNPTYDSTTDNKKFEEE